MTGQEKQILIKDLCARLPYGVKVKVETTDGNGNEIKDEGVLNSVFIDEYGMVYICIDSCEYELGDFKPYLRPMSSMTEEEETEFEETLQYTQYTLESYDWLNEHHFDFRGFIPMGIALKAPEGMYETKTE